MRTVYLVNDSTDEGISEVFMPAFKQLADAIAYVSEWILIEPHFRNLSKKCRDECALEWLQEVECY